MMNRVQVLLMGLFVLAGSALADEDQVLLRKQFELLSARVTQLSAQVEAGKQDRLRVAQLEWQLEVEKQNSARIATLEKQVVQGRASSNVVARLDALEKKPDIPQWALNTEVHGDLRYRYENSTSGSGTAKDRQRIRARIGAYGKVNDFVDYGIRFASGNGSATSANETLGDNFQKDDAQFDLYYIDIHPEQLKGAHVLLGKMKKPWIKGSGLIWDGDT